MSTLPALPGLTASGTKLSAPSRLPALAGGDAASNPVPLKPLPSFGPVLAEVSNVVGPDSPVGATGPAHAAVRGGALFPRQAGNPQGWTDSDPGRVAETSSAQFAAPGQAVSGMTMQNLGDQLTSPARHGVKQVELNFSSGNTGRENWQAHVQSKQIDSDPLADPLAAQEKSNRGGGGVRNESGATRAEPEHPGGRLTPDHANAQSIDSAPTKIASVPGLDSTHPSAPTTVVPASMDAGSEQANRRPSEGIAERVTPNVNHGLEQAESGPRAEHADPASVDMRLDEGQADIGLMAGVPAKRGTANAGPAPARAALADQWLERARENMPGAGEVDTHRDDAGRPESIRASASEERGNRADGMPGQNVLMNIPGINAGLPPSRVQPILEPGPSAIRSRQGTDSSVSIHQQPISAVMPSEGDAAAVSLEPARQAMVSSGPQTTPSTLQADISPATIRGTGQDRGVESGANIAVADVPESFSTPRSSAAGIGVTPLSVSPAGAPVPPAAVPVFGAAATPQAFTDQLIWSVKQGIQQVELRLQPEKFGRVDVHMRVENDQVQIQVITSTAGGREVVEASIGRLRDMLAEQGLNLAQADISDGSATSDPRSSGTGATARQATGTDGGDANSADSDGGTAANANTRKGLLDTFA